MLLKKSQDYNTAAIAILTTGCFAGTEKKYYCPGFSGILELRTCGKCLLIHVHFEICFLNRVKITLTFWLSSSEKILEFRIFVNIQAKYQEQNEQNVFRVT